MPVSVSILVFGGVVLAFDALWSLIARQFGLRYAHGAWVSLAIYTVSGLVAGLEHENAPNNLLIGALVGLAVASIDSTLGWYISAIIGPGKPAPDQAIAKTIIFTVSLGLLFGALGGVMSSLRYIRGNY